MGSSDTLHRGGFRGRRFGFLCLQRGDVRRSDARLLSVPVALGGLVCPGGHVGLDSRLLMGGAIGAGSRPVGLEGRLLAGGARAFAGGAFIPRSHLLGVACRVVNDPRAAEPASRRHLGQATQAEGRRDGRVGGRGQERDGGLARVNPLDPPHQAGDRAAQIGGPPADVAARLGQGFDGCEEGRGRLGSLPGRLTEGPRQLRRAAEAGNSGGAAGRLAAFSSLTSAARATTNPEGGSA